MRKIYQKNFLLSLLTSAIVLSGGELYFFYFYHSLIAPHSFFLLILSFVVFILLFSFLNYRFKKNKEIFKMLETINCPVLILNKELRIIKYNKKAEEELNLKEYFCRKREIYFSPLSFEIYDEKGNRFTEDFVPRDGIIRIKVVEKDVYFEMRCKGIENEKGKIKNYVITLLNITELIETSKRIEDSYRILETTQSLTKNIYFADSFKELSEIFLKEFERIEDLIKADIYLKKGNIFSRTYEKEIYDEKNLNFINKLLKREIFMEENLPLKKEFSKFEDKLLKRNIFSYFCVPLFTYDSLSGFILCGFEKTGKIDEKFIKSMEEIADTFSLWNEKISLFQETQEYLKNLKMIAEMVSKFAQITDVEETYRYAVKKSKEISNADWVVIFLLDKNKKNLIATCVLDVPEDIVKRYSVVPLNTVTGKAIIEKNTIFVEDYLKDTHAIKDDFLPRYLKSMIVIPIRDEKDNVIGAIDLIYKQNRKFSEREKEVYNAMGYQIGIAIQNAKLYEELKKYTTQLEKMVKDRTQKIEKLNKELEEYIYSVSHDLRTPLMAIEGYSHILLTRFGKNLGVEVREYIKHINNAAKRTANLIKDLLRYSKLGKTELKIENVNVKDVLRYVHANFKAEIEKENVKIEYPENFPLLKSNFELLTQIFQNLISNSIKFRKKNEDLLIKVYYKLDPEKIKIYFEDNGIGIESEYLPKIFNIFTQIDKNLEGTGIGLAIVKKAVEVLNGKVTVSSTPGKGTTFCFEFEYS